MLTLILCIWYILCFQNADLYSGIPLPYSLVLMELIHQLSNSTMKILRLPSSFSQSSVSLDFDTARILPLSLRILRWYYELRMPGLFADGLIRYHPHFLRRREALLCSRVTPICL